MALRRDGSFSSSTLRLTVACLIAALALVGTGAAKPRLVLADTPDPVPLYDRWTTTSQIFQNADGTLSADVYSSPVQSPEPTSPTGWSPVDTTLQSTSEG